MQMASRQQTPGGFRDDGEGSPTGRLQHHMQIPGYLAACLLQGEGRCRWHACRVRAHQQGGHMVQINHLIFMGGGGGAGVSPRLEERSAAAGRLGT